MTVSPEQREGDWFGVPLREGGFAVGVVARASKAGIMFGYFFGPRRDLLPTPTELDKLVPDGAVLVDRFGHLGLKSGRWPTIGKSEGWDRSRWAMPPSIRNEQFTGRSFRVVYDEDDPNRFLREEEIGPGVVEQGPIAGLMGAAFVESMLTKLLG